MEFRDLKRQYEHMKEKVDRAISEVIASAGFIAGEQVWKLEETLAAYVDRKTCISCANGTDAISIALMAAGVGEAGGGSKKDAVFVPDFTFFSSGECPATIGATPIFTDINESTYNIDPDALEKAIKKVKTEDDLIPRAVIAVDLFGQPFDYERIRELCSKYDMLLLEDAAQGFGGYYMTSSGEKIKAGKLGGISTTSFYPAKPLGCYGDGGAIFTDDARIADLCRSIAWHGKDTENPANPVSAYENIRLGMNSRLDTIQAAILLAKFPDFTEHELDDVNHVAALYSDRLKDIKGLGLPQVEKNCFSSWAQYTIRLPEGADRRNIQQRLRTKGIPTQVYYFKPMHKQVAFKNTRSADADCPVAEKLCNRVLSLPVHPYLSDIEVKWICEELNKALMEEI
ncbi:MAG: DegT/DnrJ/EryC1/StrS aminotransferase family protein [Eubacteriales bacterium]|nr:DegT/DnrJ/EryC1/StrS aminotransferase family protein [Eubacteriales bacterium]